MGHRISKHGDCLICHPDLNKKYAKHEMKGLKRLSSSTRRRLQDNLDDLLKEAANDIDMIEEIADCA